jgi:hypothetical protein
MPKTHIVETRVPRVDFFPIGEAPLADLLGLSEPPFLQGSAFRQLEYIERYLGQEDFHCKSLSIERHYIDRDYMEDHSVFYSRSHRAYHNWCQRVHFFSIGVSDLRAKLKALTKVGFADGVEEYRRACEEFSSEFYLGFSVIKPLRGCPIGRTVLRPYRETSGGLERHFECTRWYRTNLAGIRLAVKGLAFQQQDVGVSACATTALWSAMQKVRDFEDIAAATPAQITRLASQYTLPFGRSMPSEGLSIDQMCQAIQALGVSPNLLRVENFEAARSYLYSAALSGLAPVLILKEVLPSPRLAHAVTLVGMETCVTEPVPILGSPFVDRAADLRSIFVHDDRRGPYIRAELREASGRLRLIIANGGSGEDWNLSHILIPLHGKIRLSFADLRLIADRILKNAEAYRDARLSTHTAADTTIQFESMILRAPTYTEELFIGANKLSKGKAERIRVKLSLPRYVGVVRLSASYFGCMDVLIDTTSTPRNVTCLAIIIREERSALAKPIGQFLAGEYECRYIA